MPLLTKTEIEKREKFKAVRKLYNKLAADERNQKSAIEQKIMDKCGIKARSTVWYILSQDENSFKGTMKPKELQAGVENNLNPKL